MYVDMQPHYVGADDSVQLVLQSTPRLTNNEANPAPSKSSAKFVAMYVDMQPHYVGADDSVQLVLQSTPRLLVKISAIHHQASHLPSLLQCIVTSPLPSCCNAC